MTTEQCWQVIDAWLRQHYAAHPDDDRSDLDILLSADFQGEGQTRQAVPGEGA